MAWQSISRALKESGRSLEELEAAHPGIYINEDLEVSGLKRWQTLAHWLEVNAVETVEAVQTAAPAVSATGRTGEAVRVGGVKVGDILHHRGRKVQVVSARSITITDDMPSTWGSDLLGCEGDRGVRFTYREIGPWS